MSLSHSYRWLAVPIHFVSFSFVKIKTISKTSQVPALGTKLGRFSASGVFFEGCTPLLVKRTAEGCTPLRVKRNGERGGGDQGAGLRVIRLRDHGSG